MARLGSLAWLQPQSEYCQKHSEIVCELHSAIGFVLWIQRTGLPARGRKERHIVIDSAEPSPSCLKLDAWERTKDGPIIGMIPT
jgi:hypothetical protein